SSTPISTTAEQTALAAIFRLSQHRISFQAIVFLPILALFILRPPGSTLLRVRLRRRRQPTAHRRNAQDGFRSAIFRALSRQVQTTHITRAPTTAATRSRRAGRRSRRSEERRVGKEGGRR